MFYFQLLKITGRKPSSLAQKPARIILDLMEFRILDQMLTLHGPVAVEIFEGAESISTLKTTILSIPNCNFGKYCLSGSQ